MAEPQRRGLIRLPPPQPRKNKKVIGAVLGLGAVVVFGIVLWQLRGGNPPLSRDMIDRPVAETKAREMPNQLREDLKYPATYNNRPLVAQTVPTSPGQQMIPDAPPTRPVTATQSMQTTVQTPGGLPQSTPQRGMDAGPDRRQGGGPSKKTQTQQETPIQRVASTDAGQDDKWRWFSTPPQPSGKVLLPPFADDQKERAEKGGKGEIFSAAVWETPERPEKILYSSQLVHGQLGQGINSYIPGTVRIKVTQNVEDKWGLGNVLIPIDTMFIARQVGQAQYGDNRFNLEVYAGELPNGTVLSLQGQAGSADGSVGVPANVQNHYGKLLLGTGLSAVLSLSARIPFGSSDSYRPPLPEELAKNMSEDINASGQQIIQRELMRRPTLSQLAGYPVTLSFSKPISFMNPPKKVSK